MHRKRLLFRIRSFVVIALVATAPAPTIDGHDINIAQAQDQMSASAAVGPPLVLAQGRCFNGRCF
jgi:hypothetical protein